MTARMCKYYCNTMRAARRPGPLCQHCDEVSAKINAFSRVREQGVTPTPLPRLLLQMLALEAITLWVWCFKSLGMNWDDAFELAAETWHTVNSTDVIPLVALKVAQEAIERSVVSEELGESFTPALALKVLAEMRLRRYGGEA